MKIKDPITECPKCHSKVWDNREKKKSSKSPDFRCKNKECDEPFWLPKDENPASAPSAPVATRTSGLDGLTAQQQANARQMVRESYTSTMAYIAGAMQKIAKDTGIPITMDAVQAATFSVYNTMDKKGLIPSHLKAPMPTPPKREPEPPRRQPEPPPMDDDDYPEALRDEPDDLPFD